MIADRLTAFPRGNQPRHAAVSSFGFGGTNVHTILEEAPHQPDGTPSRPLQLLLTSARTATALDASNKSLAEHFQGTSEIDFADAAYTLQVGRKQMAYRGFVVAGSSAEAAKLLREPHPLRCAKKRCERRNPAVVFMFGGQGSQYVNMGQNLYRDEPLFRAVVDDCCDLLKPLLGRDLRELLFPAAGDEATAQQSLQDTFFTQPSIFVIEYALARFWQSLGIQPSMMVGHSIGEFVAATLAGVWDPQDVLRIVALRGRLMQNLPRGSMLSVAASAESVQKTLPESLQMASDNAPSLCVVAGPDADIAAFKESLERQNIFCRLLHTSHAFHSAMMEPMLEPLRAEIAKVRLRAPALPFVSTVTGKPITEREATDPGYWSRHARATVQFSQAVRWLIENQYDVFLECGPRATLCSLARKQFTAEPASVAVPSLADSHAENAEWATMLFALGALWQNGVSVDWDAFYAHEARRRVPLPGYPFERQRYWVEPVTQAAGKAAVAGEFVFASRAVTLEAPSGPERPLPGALRKDRVVEQLVEMLIPISGRDRKQISTTATFLDQGMDSLSLTQVAFAIRKQFGHRITFSQLMNEMPNVEMVAAYLDKALPPDLPVVESPPEPASIATVISKPPVAQTQSESSGLEAVIAEQARTISRLVEMLERTGKSGPTSNGVDQGKLSDPPADENAGPSAIENAGQPATLCTVESTLPQRGIYFSSRLSDRLSACYNESMTLYVRGLVSVTKLTRAITRLVQRHDALRAAFDESGTSMRIVPRTVHVPVVDLSPVTDQAERKRRLDELIAQETALAFPLPEGPLFRSQIVLLSPDSAAIVFSAHHTICDGWSLDVLIHDLCAFYSEEVSGSPAALQPVSSYAEYVRAVTRRAQSPEFDEARDYWRNKFADGFHALVLPTSRPRLSRREFAASRMDRALPAHLVSDLRALASRQGCSFFALLLSGLSLLLARISGQSRFVIALPTAEQPAVGQPDLVGHCVNMVPFEVNLMPEESLAALLARVQRDIAAAHDHVAYPLVNLLEELRPVQHLHGVVSISAGLTNVKKWNPKDLPQSGFVADYEVNPKSYESLEWYLNAVEAGDAVELKCQFDRQLFDDETVAAWLSAYEDILSRLASDSSRSVMDLAGLTPGRASGSEVLYALGSADMVIGRDASLLADRSIGYTSPRTETEKTLVEIWQEALRLPRVGIHEDFFELGGQSLSAVVVTTKIEQAFATRLPLSALIEAPTVSQLAELISESHAKRNWSPLVALEKKGSKSPIFLFHSHGGNVLEYQALARRLHRDSDRPVYALQSRGLDGSQIEEPRVEEMAAYYLQQIRSVQRYGPYYLGGFCLGGMLALEAAQQLRSEGERVDLVFMINTPTARYLHYSPEMRSAWRRYHRWSDRLALELSYLSSRAAGHRMAYLWTRAKRVRDVCQIRAEMFWDNLVTREHGPVPRHSLGYHLEHLAMAYDRAWEAYEPRPYEGKVLQICASRQPSGIHPDPTLGWANLLTGEFSICSIDGFRQNLLDEPAVEFLAASIEHALEECESKDKPFDPSVTDYKMTVQLAEPGRVSERPKTTV